MTVLLIGWITFHVTNLFPTSLICQMAGIDLFSSSVSSGCHTSTISTSLVVVPLCHTSCSKLSSNTNNFPSSQVLKIIKKIQLMYNKEWRHMEHIQQCSQTFMFTEPLWLQKFMMKPENKTKSLRYSNLNSKARVRCRQAKCWGSLVLLTRALLQNLNEQVYVVKMVLTRGSKLWPAGWMQPSRKSVLPTVLFI